MSSAIMTSILGFCCCVCVGLGAGAGACACTGPCSDVVASSNPAAIAAKRADPKSGALICDLLSKYENCCSCAGALHHDFDAAVFRAAVRRVVRGDRKRVAEAFGRDHVGIDALRLEIRYDVVSPPR